MSKKDPNRQWIDRHVSSPVVSYDWAPNFEDVLKGKEHNGYIEEWRKVAENIRRRRGKNPVGSQLWHACEEALGLVAFITEAGRRGAVTGDWRPGHEILTRIAEIWEMRKGKIDPLIQCVVREAMDEAYTSERFET